MVAVRVPPPGFGRRQIRARTPPPGGGRDSAATGAPAPGLRPDGPSGTPLRLRARPALRRTARPKQCFGLSGRDTRAEPASVGRRLRYDPRKWSRYQAVGMTDCFGSCSRRPAIASRGPQRRVSRGHSPQSAPPEPRRRAMGVRACPAFAVGPRLPGWREKEPPQDAIQHPPQGGAAPVEHRSSHTVGPNGRSRSRFPVARKMPLAIAGAIGGTPGSPTPEAWTLNGCSTMWTLTVCGKLSERTIS